MKKKQKKNKLHSCNVVQIQPEGSHLWQFQTDGRIKLVSEQTAAPGQALPPKIVTKDWHNLVQKKLNIAWLPADQVFLRVLHLPLADFPELLSMVDLQLEKISPIPVHQAVWTIELLSGVVDNMQPVVVVIATREVVEEYLGRLEQAGYLADRLEVPHVHRLLTTEVTGDGIWIYFGSAAERLALVAWWYGGTLRNLQLVHLPADSADHQVPLLIEQLTQMAWAAEMEGWFEGKPKVHLVSEGEHASVWQAQLADWSGEPAEIITPFSNAALADLAVHRNVRGEATGNLIPEGYGQRYYQDYVDRLWMRGVGAAIAAYVLVVVIYIGWLQILGYQQTTIRTQVAGLSQSYTNALQLKERIDVLQDQLNLKYAALDCWKVASELLPTDLTLTRLNLRDGQSLVLEGVVPSDKNALVMDYNQALREATINGERLFESVDPPKIYSRQGSAGNSAWDFEAELYHEDSGT